MTRSASRPAASPPNATPTGMPAAHRGERSAGVATALPATYSSALALRPREAAKALSISPRLLWELTKKEQIPCVRLGSGRRQTVLYPVAILQAWLARQAEATKGGDHGTR
jgi:hypothetical protein